MEWVRKEEISAELIAGGEKRREEDEEEEGEREGRHGERRGPFGEEKGGGFERREEKGTNFGRRERWGLEKGEDLGVREGGESMSDWGFLCVVYFLGNLEDEFWCLGDWGGVIRLVLTRINGGIEIRVKFE